MLFVIFAGLACLAASAYFVGDAVSMPARERRSSVRRAAQYGDFKPLRGHAQRPFRERVVAPLGERLARWTLKLHPKTTVEGVSTRLMAAGLLLAAGGRMLLSRNLPRNVDVMMEVLRFHVDAPVLLCTIVAAAA